VVSEYSNEELVAIFELGRLYFEMGYFAPAERIFAGLSVVDDERTPCRIGLGLVKLERGLFQEATTHFRQSLQIGKYPILAKLGLCAAFVAMKEMSRAQSILAEISNDPDHLRMIDPDQQRLFEALVLRCRA
jgi:hypothetical protein